MTNVQGIQDNLDMLQQSQTDTVRQLAQDMVAALEDSESQLQVRLGHPLCEGPLRSCCCLLPSLRRGAHVHSQCWL